MPASGNWDAGDKGIAGEAGTITGGPAPIDAGHSWTSQSPSPLYLWLPCGAGMMPEG